MQTQTRTRDQTDPLQTWSSCLWRWLCSCRARGGPAAASPAAWLPAAWCSPAPSRWRSRESAAAAAAAASSSSRHGHLGGGDGQKDTACCQMITFNFNQKCKRADRVQSESMWYIGTRIERSGDTEPRMVHAPPSWVFGHINESQRLVAPLNMILFQMKCDCASPLIVSSLWTVTQPSFLKIYITYFF